MLKVTVHVHRFARRLAIAYIISLQSKGGSMISGKGVHMYTGVGYTLLIFFLKYPMKMKEFGLNETKLFHFHRIFINGG